MLKKLLFLCLVAMPAFPGLTQIPYLRTHELFSGRADYTVEAIHQDINGLIWIGTDQGLFRFDGITLEAYTEADGLAEDRISAIGCAWADEVWIGHPGGDITIFDGQKLSVFRPEEGMGKVEISDIAFDPSGWIWYSTLGEGVYRYNQRHISNVSVEEGLSDKYVYDIEIDSSGNLWFATDYGISILEKDTFQNLSMKDGLPDNIVRDITISGNRAWIGFDESGFASINIDSRRITTYGNWNFGTVTGIMPGSEGNLWATTGSLGIVRLDIWGDTLESVQQISREHGLASSRLGVIMKDMEENIWIGGRGILVQALPALFEFMEPSTGLPFEKAFSILRDKKGNLWVCSERGLFKGIPGEYGNLAWVDVSQKMDLEGTSFISLFQDSRGKVWAGTYGMGLVRIDPGSYSCEKYTTSEGLPDNDVIHLSGTDERLWISTLGRGVCSFNLEEDRFETYDSKRLSGSYVYSTLPDQKDRIWIAGLLDCPLYIEGEEVRAVEDTSFAYPQLYGIALDSGGDVWFNTLTEKVIRISGTRLEPDSIPFGAGLKEIQSIIFDRHGNLLIFANNGLQIIHPERGTQILMDENSGLGYRYPLLNSVFRDQDENIWFGTETGIIKYNPGYLHIVDQEPVIFLSTANLSDIPIDRNRIRYPHRSNNFTFGYTGLWFKNPELLRYRYMLEGYDPNWTYYDRNRILSYPKLAPGKYTFLVEVSTDGRRWTSGEKGRYSFTITPPVWKRWWFLLSAVLLLVTGIILYIRFRLAYLEQAKKELEIEVRKRTEQIRNKNLALQAQKEEIEAQRDLAHEQKDWIEQQSREIQSSIRYAHRIQSAALPPKQVLDSHLMDYFILNRPRDIVSGDFYWVSTLGDKLLFAVGDCTGHGVPGAFMSMLGISALNDIARSIEEVRASLILDQLRDRIRQSLHQASDHPASSFDGMDISLCVYETETKKLQFAGAHNPLYVMRNGNIQIIPADKQDIGSKLLEFKPFQNHTLDIEPGDSLYLFTDGFPDQFGGPQNKKYKTSRFRHFLESIQKHSMQDQATQLEIELLEWMGDYPQIDDILVMGVRCARVETG